MTVVDFFNVSPNKKYVLNISVVLDNNTSYPIHATRIFIPADQILFPDKNGKATGNFDFNLTIE
ncbi:hypothetical protein [Streptococcus merionis]|uniref:hypothetical protein n=1 Tax=Streptococcus merionis TaxID=400065 RepID=UPI0011AB6C72|nr:hypothetical protein [Streptococcus merionis]